MPFLAWLYRQLHGPVNMNNAISQQMFSSLAGSFFQMLFSSDSKADAQKQQMMTELQLRQAAAEKQHNIVEAQRLAAICNGLPGDLKAHWPA